MSPEADFVPSNRDYSKLFTALSQALDGLAQGKSVEDVLAESFKAAREGCGARVAALFLVERLEPLRLRALQVSRLSVEQVEALQKGESTPGSGVSAGVIRRVLAAGRPEVIQDPRLAQAANETAGWRGGQDQYSVLCAPIVDQLERQPVAVLYFQNGVINERYSQLDVEWIDTYSRALGQAFGLWFQSRKRERDMEQLLRNTERPNKAPELVGDDRKTSQLRKHLHRVVLPGVGALKPRPILITGPKGSGKDIVARYIQAWSDRRKGPFVIANCGELANEQMAASLLFGHVRGAFTGALNDAKGFFREAEGGVLFLDEIGNLPMSVQSFLLRVIDNHEVTPVGGKTIRVDVLVIAATNADLETMSAQKQFRDDLLDRLEGGEHINLEPLVRRPGDIVPLVRHFLRLAENDYGKRTLGVNHEAMRALSAYHWPGNVRELKTAVERCLARTEPGEPITRRTLLIAYPQVIDQARKQTKSGYLDPVDGEPRSFKEIMADARRNILLDALEAAEGNHDEMRRLLRMSRTTWRRQMIAAGLKTVQEGEDEAEGPDDGPNDDEDDDAE